MERVHKEGLREEGRTAPLRVVSLADNLAQACVLLQYKSKHRVGWGGKRKRARARAAPHPDES